MSDLELSKALVFCAHPDDGEFSNGGTMARWAAEGTEVVLCVVTNGAAGSNDPTVDRDWLIETRRQEQKEAAAITGVSDVVFLEYEDGFVEDSHELRRDMIREIRRHKPDVVVGPDPSTWYVEQRYVNHPDHRKVGQAFLAAVNPGSTTVPLYRADLFDQGFGPHKLKACLLGFSANSDHFVDITDFIDTKIAAIKAHRSQTIHWHGLEESVKVMGSSVAERSGQAYRYAEGYKALFFQRRS